MIVSDAINIIVVPEYVLRQKEKLIKRETLPCHNVILCSDTSDCNRNMHRVSLSFLFTLDVTAFYLIQRIFK